MFGLNFREILPQIVVDEFDNVVTQIGAFLSREHNNDGTHADITADTVTTTGNVRGGGLGFFNGNVTADADGKVVEIGSLLLAGSNRPVAGIEMPGDTRSRWRIGAFNGGSPITPTRELLFIDRLSSDPYAFRVFWDTANSRYVLAPGTGVTFQIGDLTFGRAADIYSSGKVYERGRVVAMGDRVPIAHNDALYAGDATGNADWVVGAADQVTLSYSRVGEQISAAVVVVNSDVANAPTELQVELGFTAAVFASSQGDLVDAGAAQIPCRFFVRAGQTKLYIARNDGAAFTNGTGTTNVSGSLTFWV